MKKIVCISLSVLMQLVFVSTAIADDTSPAALRKAREDELDSIKARDQLKYEEAQAQQDFEKKKAAIDKEITARKKHIYDLRQQEGEFAEAIKQLKDQTAELEGQKNELQKLVDVTETKGKMQAEAHARSRDELENKKNELSTSIASLNKTRDENGKKINNYLVQMQQARVEISNAETMIARAENDKVRAEAEELQLRTQWASLSAQAETLREEKEKVVASMNEQKARLEIARKDYLATKADTEKMIKEKVALEQEALKKNLEIAAEMRKLEQETSFAYTQKATAESEKVRIAAETKNLQEKLIFTAKRNEESHQQLVEGQGMLMETRLAFETAKADLANENARGETEKLRYDAKMVKARALASVVESSDMLEVQKTWVATKDCKLTRTPADTQETQSRVHVGDRLIAAPGPAGYVKVLNTSGRPYFVPSDCGKFFE